MKDILRTHFWVRVFLGALFLLLLNGMLEARFVLLSEVRQAAARLLEMENRRPDLRLTQDTFQLNGIEALFYQDQPVAYLIKLAPQGFMILSDITEVSPQVFISFRGDFDSLQEHPFLISIMNRLRYNKVHLCYLIPDDNSNAQYIPEDIPDFIQMERNNRAWTALLNNSVTTRNMEATMQSPDSVGPLLRVWWSQGSPFWNYTPRISGRQTVTGCTATAIAQVMYFWKHPGRGQGSHSYTWNNQTLSANFDHPYYWDRMLPYYSSGYSSGQADAVARLMSDVGISIDMNYGLDGSGASVKKDALVSFFKYSSDMSWKFRTNVANWEAWFYIFKQQLDIGYPVLLATWNSNSGHEVVIDGYRTSPSNQVHVNMGWGGGADNYYDMSNIYGYGDESDSATINIYPVDRRLTLQTTSGGTTDPAPGTYSFGSGTGINIRITALPSLHYQFLNWSGGASGSQNPLDLILDKEITIIANFQRIIYAPLNAEGQKYINRSLSKAEYINIISFEDNPNNVEILGYDIYLIENGVRAKIGRVALTSSLNKMKFWHRGVKREFEYIYHVVAVNKESRGGDPAVIVVR